MSLVGNLEDLSLPDILQIVSLSRKSGILMLEREGQQGKIIIRQGKVIQTISPRPGKTLGELLTARGLLRPDDLKRALELQREGGGRELLGSILVRLGAIAEASLEKVVQEQIEDAIVYFLSWREGTFSFELADIEGRGEFSVDPQAFILERGIDTQWLVLEGTRLIDERERGGAAPVAAEAPAGGETSFADLDGEATPPGGGRALILVDDDPLFREMARDHLGRQGFRLVVCENGADFLAALEREAYRGEPPVVVTDIVMPTLDSQGFLGGLELLEKLRRSRPGVPAIAVTAYPDDNVRSQVEDLGGTFLLKPRVGDAGGLAGFFDRLGAVIRGAGASVAEPAAEPAAATSVPTPVPQSPAAAAPSLAEAPRSSPAQPPLEVDADGLTPAEALLLREMLEELHGPRAASEMGLLILRFAAELLNRAVLFVVKGGAAVGLGGFGVDAAGGPERRGIRGISLPLDQPSILADAVRSRAVVAGPLAPGAVNRALLDQLGGQTPAAAVALPLVSGGRVRVILYGDNLPEPRPPVGIRALELFLGQAGAMLEKVLLEKKLKESAGRPSSSPARSEQHVGGGSR